MEQRAELAGAFSASDDEARATASLSTTRREAPKREGGRLMV